MQETVIFNNYKILLLLIVFLTFSPLIVAGKYTLVIEPTYPIEQGKQVYEPLRDWLSKKTGHTIEIVIDSSYYSYWKNAKSENMPDFTFDAPHIASYRMHNNAYKAIATTIEPQFFHLIALDEPKKGESVEDFMTNKKIIMLPSPSLASIYYSQWFTDLFASPRKDIRALSWQEAVEIVFDGMADAAIVPDWIYKLYPNFASLKKSKELPGSTFLVSPKVSNEVAEAFQKALLSLIDDDAAYDVLVELNTEGFKNPTEEDYVNLYKMLD